MKNSSLSNIYAATAIAALLILTAWGNAVAMFVVSTLAIAIGLLLFGRDFARRGAVATAVACVVAIVVAVLLGRS